MTCRTLAEQIHPYIDGELPESGRPDVERHLAGCPACRESLAALQGLGRLLRRELTDPQGLGTSLWPAIEARLGEPAAAGAARVGRSSRGRLAWRTVVPALAVAAAVVAAVSLRQGGKGVPVTPPDQLAQVASVEGGDHSSVVLVAGTPFEPPIILVTESPVLPRPADGGSPL